MRLAPTVSSVDERTAAILTVLRARYLEDRIGDNPWVLPDDDGSVGWMSMDFIVVEAGLAGIEEGVLVVDGPLMRVFDRLVDEGSLDTQPPPKDDAFRLGALARAELTAIEAAIAADRLLEVWVQDLLERLEEENSALRERLVRAEARVDALLSQLGALALQVGSRHQAPKRNGVLAVREWLWP